jgi:hypothetical protein
MLFEDMKGAMRLVKSALSVTFRKKIIIGEKNIV